MSFSSHNSSSLRGQSGLSLIELMIAMALGLILTLGVVQIFLGSSKTYRLTDSLGKVQENIRFTLGTLQHDIRMAGHFGCLIGEPFNQLDYDDSEDISYGGDAVAGWDADGTNGVGQTGLGDTFEISTVAAGTGTGSWTSSWTNSLGVSTIPNAIADKMLPGTDFLVINGGQRSAVQLDINTTGNPNNLGTDGNVDIAKDTILLVTAGDCSGGDLFQKTNNGASVLTKGGGNSPGNKTPVNEKFDGDYDNDASIHVYTSTAYFIGEGTSGEPALFRKRLDAGDSSPAVELAEGVENMQILYGVASGIDRNAGTYVTAADVPNWDQVVSVRMALLFRTGDTITDVAEARVFNLAGTEVTTQSDRRARVVGLSTVGIRNRLE